MTIIHILRLQKYYQSPFTNPSFYYQWFGKRIGRIPVQTLIGAQPGLATQTHYKASTDLQVETKIKNAMINIRLQLIESWMCYVIRCVMQ